GVLPAGGVAVHIAGVRLLHVLQIDPCVRQCRLDRALREDVVGVTSAGRREGHHAHPSDYRSSHVASLSSSNSLNLARVHLIGNGLPPTDRTTGTSPGCSTVWLLTSRTRRRGRKHPCDVR